MSETVIDGAIERLGMLADRDVLLRRWRAGDPDFEALGSEEHRTLAIVRRAAEARRDLAVLVPSGLPRLPVLAAVLVELAEARRVAPAGNGPTVVMTSNPVRRHELAELVTAGESVLPGVRARRLRHDGLECTFAGSSIRVVTPIPGLLFVHPQVGWPAVIGKITGAVLVDATGARSLDQAAALVNDARHWAARNELAPVVSFLPLAARHVVETGTLTWPLDWAYLCDDTGASAAVGLDRDATASSGTADVFIVNDDRIEGLEQARRRLWSTDTHAPWPPALGNAARLARLLIDLAVPCDVYDAHVVHAVGRTLAARADLLENTAVSDLGPGFELFGETDWAGVRRGVMDGYEALKHSNRKAPALVSLLEDALRRDQLVDVITSSATGAAALRTWLASSGAGITVEDLASKRVRVRPLGVPCPWDQSRVTVFAGVPPAALIWRLDGGDIGSMTLVCYPQEGGMAVSALRRALAPLDPATAASHRATTLTELLRVDANLHIPAAVDVSIHTSIAMRPRADVVDPFSFLDEPRSDYHFDPTEDEQPDTTGTLIPVVRLVVTLGDGSIEWVSHVRRGRRLDRILDDTITPVRAVDVAPGMLVMGAFGEAAPIFERVRPALDVLCGVGTRTWLTVWNLGLDAALVATDGPRGLSERLADDGITITGEAIAVWPSAYRIGPADRRAIAAVGRIARNPALTEHTAKIHEAMQRVRALHRQLGRGIADAARSYVAGDHDAFARLEDRLGVALADAANDISPWRVVAEPELGFCPAGLAGRLVPASTLGFLPEADDSHPGANSATGQASRSEQR